MTGLIHAGVTALKNAAVQASTVSSSGLPPYAGVHYANALYRNTRGKVVVVVCAAK